MNRITHRIQPVVPPAQTPPVALPPAPVLLNRTARLPTVLTATVSSFLDPLDLGHFAQTSTHNYRGAEMAIRARLNDQSRNSLQPFSQFANPKNRKDTAVPIDDAGLDYLSDLTINGPLMIELIKTGACSIRQIQERIEDIEAWTLAPEAGDDDILTNATVFDYIVADLITCDQVHKLEDKLTSDVIENLMYDSVRECIKNNYLTFEQALNLTDVDMDLLDSPLVQEGVRNGQAMNLNELLIRNMLALEFPDLSGSLEIENLVQQSAGCCFSKVREDMEQTRQAAYRSLSGMNE